MQVQRVLHTPPVQVLRVPRGGILQLSFSDYAGLKYFRGLDGLRALSVIMVISHHMVDRPFYWLDGASGVSIFFVISGYLITTLLLREEKSKNRVSLKAFYIRRTFRIFQIYYVVLAVYCILIFGIDAEVFASKRAEMKQVLPYYLFYMNELVPPGSGTGAGFGHSWSLGIEEKFYLVWPVLGFVLIAPFWKWRLPLVLSLGVMMLVLNAYLPNLGFISYYQLMVGCLLAVLVECEGSYRAIGMLLGRTGTALIIAAFVIIHLAKREYMALGYLYPFAVALLITVIVTTNTWLTKFLETRPMRTCGRLSYGIYLIHVLAVHVVQYFIEPGSRLIHIGLAILVFSTLLATLGAYFMNVLIERPLIRKGKQLAARYS